MNKPGISPNLLLVLFILICCPIIVLIDGIIGITIWEQLQATRFPTAPATILSSQVVRESRRKGGSVFAVDVEFKYRVAEREYVSRRYSFDSFKSSDSGWAQKVVALNPPGAQRTCYYDPRDPSIAILQPGIDGAHLLMLLIVAPFHGITAGVIHYLDRARRGGKTLIRKSPWATFFTVFALASFLGIFVLIIPNGFHPPIRSAIMVWGAVGMLALASAAWTWAKISSQTSRAESPQ